MLKESILDNINPRNDTFQRFFRFALTNDKIIESFKRIKRNIGIVFNE